jgi:membrane AbrB-like protein
LRTLAFILLGIQTGGSVSWGTLERAAQWPLSVSLLAVSVVAVTAACAYFFRRLHRWDRATALFASLPGALSLTLALADEARADMQRVTIAQCIRLFFLVAALPAVISLMSAPPAVLLPTATYDLRSIFLLIMACSAGGFLLERLRIPAGFILGAIFVSAVLHLAGSVIGGTPNVILIPTNVILGVMIGGRFKGLPFAEIRLLYREGFAGFLLALSISSVGAALASGFGGLPLPLTLLAFSPGGLEAMTIMAFALNLDPAYVAAHQVARYLGICIVMPPLAAWLMGRPETLVEVETSPNTLNSTQ